MADVVSIGIALDTSQVLQGTKAVDTALRQVQAASASTAQSTKQVDQASRAAGQAMQTESSAALATAQALRQSTQASQAAAQALAQQKQATQAARDALYEMEKAASAAGQQAGESTQTLGRHASTARGAIERLGQSLIAFGGAALALNTVKNAFEGMVQAALKVESLTASFKAVTGSAQTAGAEFDFVRETANRLGQNVFGLAEQYKGLMAAGLAAGLSMNDNRQILLGLVEAGRAYQLSQEDMQGAIRPVTQMLAQQKIQGDELRTELSTRIPIMKLLVEATAGAAKTQDEFNDMMDKGAFSGKAAAVLVYNLTQLLRRDFGPAATEAAQGAGASFARFQTAVTDLQAALGRELLPVLADVARAWTEMTRTATGAANSIGPAFTVLIREAASAVTGLAGSVAVLVKVMEFLHSPINDPAEIAKRWGQLKETIDDVATAQNQILNPPQLTRLNPKLPPVPYTPDLRQLPAGDVDEKKARGKTAADKEATRLAAEQLSLRTQINDAYDKATNSERQLTALHLERAKFSEKERDALMARYDETKLYEEANRLKDERLALDTQLQEALDKQVYSERELLQRKMEHLLYSKEEMAINLKLYDQEKARREEKERAVEAEKEAVRASEEHLRVVERLMGQLEPQRRRMSRSEQLQQTMSELAGGTSDPYTLAQADQRRETTLAFEEMQDQLKRLEDLGESVFGHLGDFIEAFVFKGKLDFKGMMDSIAQDLFRFATQTLMQSATKKGGWLEMGLDLGLKALGIAGGAAGSGTLAINPSNVPTGWSVVPAAQHGGPVMAGQPYMVGEAGPELFVPRTSGTVLPHGQGVSAPTIVNVHVSGVQDAQSFVQSRGAVSRAMMSALSQARQQM